jgi:hypothetical protein
VLSSRRRSPLVCRWLLLIVLTASLTATAGCGDASNAPHIPTNPMPAKTTPSVTSASRSTPKAATAPHWVSDIVVVCASGQIVGYDGTTGEQLYVHQRPAALEESVGHCSAYSNGSWSPDFQRFVHVEPVASNGDLPVVVDIASGETHSVGATQSTDGFNADAHQAMEPAIDYEGHVWWLDAQDTELAVMRETEQMATVDRDKYGTPSFEFAPGGKWELVGGDVESPLYIAPDGSTSKHDPLRAAQIRRVPAEQLASVLPETELQTGDGLESSDHSMIYYVVSRPGGLDRGQLWVQNRDGQVNQPLSPEPLPAPPGRDNPAPDGVILGVVPPSVKVDE